MLDDVAGTTAGLVVAFAARIANASPTGAAVSVALAYVVMKAVQRLERHSGVDR